MEKLTKILSWIVLVAMTIVYAVAQAAAFTHMHDWSMQHLPHGTHPLFGWANAVISEVIPAVGMILLFLAEVNRRPKGWAVFLLIFGLFLSGNAQMAEAKNFSYSALFVALLPAVAAGILLKVAFGLMDQLGIAPKVAHEPVAQVAHDGVAQASEPAPAGWPTGWPTEVAQTDLTLVVGHPEPPAAGVAHEPVAHDEPAGQPVGHPDPEPVPEVAHEPAHEPAQEVAQSPDEPVAQPTPRAAKKVAQKPRVGRPTADPARVAQAVEAVRVGRLTQRAAAAEYGISRATLQRAMTDEPAAGGDEAARLLDGVDLDAELAEILGDRPTDDN